MKNVIRRFSFLALLLVALTACTGSGQLAVDAGDDSLSRDALIGLTVALDPSIPTDVDDTTAVSTASLRQVASAHIVNVAFVDFFEEQGGIPDGIREEVADVVVAQGNNGDIGRLEFNSVEFDTYVNILLGQRLFQESGIGEEQVRQIIIDGTSDVEVEPRLGVWDPVEIAIVDQ